MSHPAKVVAVLVSNPALSSILSAVLASAPALRVRPFETAAALLTYMQLAPVDLLVCDFDGVEAADVVVGRLRASDRLERPDFQVLALAGSLNAEIRASAARAGIDEIIVKPMSPRYLLQRVVARLGHVPSLRPLAGIGSATARRQNPALSGGNVIPLFGRHPQPLH